MRESVTWSEAGLRVAVRETCGPMVALSVDDLRRFVRALGAIHPQEHAIAKREAEREAYDAGALAMVLPLCDYANRPYDDTMMLSYRHRERDKHYPPLPPKSPPPLVLSTGQWHQVDGWWHSLSVSVAGLKEPRMQMIRTASDAEALAKWLRAYGDEKERG